MTTLASTHTGPYGLNSIQKNVLLSFNTYLSSLKACLQKNVVLKRFLERSSLSWYWNVYKARRGEFPNLINFQSAE